MPGHPVGVIGILELLQEVVPGFEGVLLGRVDRDLAEDVVFVPGEDDVRREDEAIAEGGVQVDLGSQLVDQGLTDIFFASQLLHAANGVGIIDETPLEEDTENEHVLCLAAGLGRFGHGLVPYGEMMEYGREVGVSRTSTASKSGRAVASTAAGS